MKPKRPTPQKRKEQARAVITTQFMNEWLGKHEDHLISFVRRRHPGGFNDSEGPLRRKQAPRRSPSRRPAWIVTQRAAISEPAKTSRHRHRSGLGSYFSGSRGSRSRLQLLTAPAGVNGSVMSRLFVAPMELVIWEAFGNTAAIR